MALLRWWESFVLMYTQIRDNTHKMTPWRAKQSRFAVFHATSTCLSSPIFPAHRSLQPVAPRITVWCAERISPLKAFTLYSCKVSCKAGNKRKGYLIALVCTAEGTKSTVRTCICFCGYMKETQAPYSLHKNCENYIKRACQPHDEFLARMKFWGSKARGRYCIRIKGVPEYSPSSSTPLHVIPSTPTAKSFTVWDKSL